MYPPIHAGMEVEIFKANDGGESNLIYDAQEWNKF